MRHRDPLIVLIAGLALLGSMAACGEQNDALTKTAVIRRTGGGGSRPGPSIAVTNPDRLDIAFESADGVRWTDPPITVLGTLTDAGFEVRLVSQPDR